MLDHLSTVEQKTWNLYLTSVPSVSPLRRVMLCHFSIQKPLMDFPFSAASLLFPTRWVKLTLAPSQPLTLPRFTQFQSLSNSGFSASALLSHPEFSSHKYQRGLFPYFFHISPQGSASVGL